MPNYSRNFGSKFPSSLITLGNHKDVDGTVLSLVNQYYAFLDNGDRESAYNLYNTNKTKLKPYIIDISYLNYLEEEIYNTGLLVLSQHKVIQSQTEPPSEVENDSYWVQEYK